MENKTPDSINLPSVFQKICKGGTIGKNTKFDIFVNISKVVGRFELTNIIFWISGRSFRMWLL